MDMSDFFDEPNEMDQLRYERDEKLLARRLRIEDAQYTVSTIREYGLRMWFRACRFVEVEEALTVLQWCEDVLKGDDVEDYEACALLRDERQWLADRGAQIHSEESVE